MDDDNNKDEYFDKILSLTTELMKKYKIIEITIKHIDKRTKNF